MSNSHPNGNHTHVSNEPPGELGYLSHKFRDSVWNFITLGTHPKHG